MARNAVDINTGEVVKEPDFVKVYIQDLCRVKGVRGLQMEIFLFMLSRMDELNTVSYTKVSKQRFMDSHGTTNASFNNTIKRLIEAGLIERIGKGEFRVNKKYAVKVEWSKVQSIKWTAEYTKDGKIENVEIKQG